MNQVPHELVVEAQEIANSFIDKARQLYNRSFPYPKIVWNVRHCSTVAGRANTYAWIIAFNPDYINETHFWDNTIGHEVAHLVSEAVYPKSKQFHGPEWRSVMRAFGLSEETFHNMKNEARIASRYPYICPLCAKNYSLSKITHNKFNVSPRYCGEKTCISVVKSSNYNPAYKLVYSPTVG